MSLSRLAKVLTQGAEDDGATAASYPVRVAGWDSGNVVRTLLTDSSGRLNAVLESSSISKVHGTTADGIALTGVNPVLVAGQDGTLLQSLLTDASGRLDVAHLYAVSEVVASGSRTSFSQSVQTNGRGAKGIIAHLLVSAGNATGTLQMRIWNRIDAANTYGEGILVQSTTLAGTGQRNILAYPGAGSVPAGYSDVGNGILGPFYYIDVVHSLGQAATYTIGIALIP